MLWDLEKFGTSTAVIAEDGKYYSYHDLLDYTNELYSMTGQNRCLVFNLCKNEIGSLIGYVSFINNRIVPLMLDSNIDESLLMDLVQRYQPDYLWIPEENKYNYDGQCVYSNFNYRLIKTSFSSVFTLHDDLALLLTTSGSTGSPKLVKQSYKNILSNTESIIDYLKIDEEERPITTLPMSYTYGLSILNTHLFSGASVILTERTLLEKEFWSQFKLYEATSFGGVPYIYEMLDKLRFFRMDLPSLKVFTQAGGKLSPSLHKKFAEYASNTNRKFVVMYGQTEATARMSYLPWEMSIEKYGSVGIAIPSGEFSLADVNGDLIQTPNVVGELIYKGDNVTLGYALCGDDLSKGDERNGVLFTGDMAKKDLDGYYYIVGRKKRFLKVFGSRVNLDELEALLKQKFDSNEIACGGSDDLVKVYVADNMDYKELKKFITLKTKINPVAIKTIHVDSIPRNEAGKVLYSSLV